MTSGLRSSLASLLSSPPPRVGVEIDARRVTVVALEKGRREAAVSGHATEPLPASAVVPALNAPNVLEPTVVTTALRRCFERLDIRPRKVALVVPDAVGRVSLVRFEEVPTRASELAELIRWQVRKAAPFQIADAQFAYSPGAWLPNGGREFVVTLARRDVVAEYELACGEAGAYAGLVDLASLNIINVVIASGATTRPGDWLLVHSTPEYNTLAIVRDRTLVFFRSRGADGEESLADLVHQTVMYHEDRLGGGELVRVVLAGGATMSSDEADAARRALEQRVGLTVESFDPRAAVSLRDRIGADQSLLDTLAAPLGLLLRERDA